MKFPSIRSLLVVVALVAVHLFGIACENLAAIDIGSMTWTPRSDWINIKSCSSITGGANAAGNGTTDDTAAIQAAMNYLCGGSNQNYSTIYFPAGTYKISSTLTMANFAYGQIIGCGSNTTIIWAGATGGAMFNPRACSFMHYWGLKWDGASIASCAFLDDYENNGEYVSRAHHDNESFQNFTQTGTYPYTDNNDVYHPTGGAPPAAMITGFYYGLCADSLVTNCRFYNCTNGVMVGYLITQVFEWHVDGCEFDNCDVGFNSGGGGYDSVILNSHFQGSTTCDISRGGGLRVRHCTSSGSASFFNEQGSNILDDCWIDGWTNASSSPVSITGAGTHTIFDCHFTDPPANAVPPIDTYSYGQTESLTLSNNYAPDFADGYGQIYNPFAATNDVHIIPSGERTSLVTSPSQTFLNTANFVDSANIIDVTQAPYSADKTGNTDCTSAIQSAINAASSANNGTIVYFPYGRYTISTTLTASGSNYTLQGSGCRSSLYWNGSSGSTLLTISNPNNIKVQNLDFYSSSSSPTSPGIQETASSGGSAIYDGVYYGAPYNDNNTNPGLVLTNLPSSQTVYIPYSESPLTVQNSGSAEIFCRTFLGGEIKVSGTGDKSGFCGLLDVENIEQEDPSGYVISVTDNQNLIIGDHYTESDFGDIHLSAGSGTTPGRFAIQGANDAVWDSSSMVQVDNYNGSAYISSYSASNYSGNYSTSGVNVPVKITQTGSNPVDLMLVSLNTFDGPPTVSTDSGANLIEIGNTGLVNYTGASPTFASDTPNPLTTSSYQKLSSGLDDIRQLAAVDMSLEFSINELMTNPAFEVDAPNPTPMTTMGYNPTGWTVANNVALGSGVRNVTVSSDSSPFEAGMQSLLYVDSTANTGGSQMYAVQNLTPTATSGNSPAIVTFDFRANTSASDTDIWIDTQTEWNWATGVHIAVNGPSGYGYFGSNVGGSDSYLTTIQSGVWYRVQIVCGAPTSGAAHATLYLTPWYGNGPGPTSSFTVDGYGSPQSGGFVQAAIYTGTGPGQNQSMNIDNFSIKTNAPLTIPSNNGNEQGMVAHWTLDEPVGNTSSNSSGGPDGTWENAPTFSTDVPSGFSFRDPGSLTFDGTDQCVNMGNPVGLPSGTTARSISGWAKSNGAPGGWHWIASFGSPNTDQAMFIGSNGTSLYGGGYADDLAVPNFWTDDNWHFIVLTYDGTTAKLYADGTLLTSGAKSWNLVPGGCFIGEQVNGASEYWDGSIDDVRIYNRVLSAAEISALNAGGR